MNTKHNMRNMIGILALALLSACSESAGFEIAVIKEDQAEAVEAVIEEIKPVLIAMSGYGELRPLVDFISAACTTADGLGGPPKCKPGEAQGTVVEVFPILDGEGSLARAGEIDSALEIRAKGLYAVYRPLPSPRESDLWPTGEYALLFDREQNDIHFPVTAHVQDGRIVKLVFSTGVSPSEILSGVPVEQILITPEQAPAVVDQILRSEGFR